jgi:choline dehydrogenase-like flavoprotein
MFGAGLAQLTVQGGKRLCTADAFLPRAKRDVLGGPDRQRGAGSLTISCLTHVSRVVIDGDRAVGIAFTRGSVDPAALRKQPEQQVRAAKEVILSAGAYCSPAILMRSGVSWDGVAASPPCAQSAASLLQALGRVTTSATWASRSFATSPSEITCRTTCSLTSRSQRKPLSRTLGAPSFPS